jgi:hypothetical protein
MSNFTAVTMSGAHFATKKAFRETVASQPDSVRFVDSSFFSNRGMVKISDLSPSDVIVGPDAERDRSWYANVKVTSKGPRVV